MDSEISEQQRFWVSVITEAATKTQTGLTELKKMDVFEFFALLTVVEDRNSKKR